MRPLARIQRWQGGVFGSTTATLSAPASLRSTHRGLVDMSFASEDGTDPTANAGLQTDGGAYAGGSAATAAAAASTGVYPQPRYVYPLDVTSVSFRLYSELEATADGGAGRLFSSTSGQSYDPALLYQELRAQESGAAAVVVDTQALLKADEEDMDAVMREGRDKQGAASAAAVAAAVIEVSQTARVDGIAMVPNHPLPVVFPKQEGGVTPRSFTGQSGPTANLLGQARRKARVDGEENEDDGVIMTEVMEGDGRIEGFSLHRVSTMRVTVSDEHGRLQRIRRFKSFAELPNVLPRLTQASTLIGADCPTVLQSAALPLLLDGRDLFAISPHGSGRGLAYALPAIQCAQRRTGSSSTANTNPTAPSAAGTTTAPTSSTQDAAAVVVVVAPTVLVLCCSKQTVRQRGIVLHNLAEAVEDATACTPILEGYDANGDQFCRASALQDVAYLVATVDYVVQQCQAGRLSLHRVRFLAVDGVVESAAYMSGLREVASLVRRNRVSHQACVWGFTPCAALQEAAQICLSPHHMRLTVTREVQATTQARQVLYLVPSKADRLTLLQRLFDQRVIQKREQTLICCGYREVAETLAAFLTASLAAPPSLVKFIHSGVRERRRLGVLNDFHNGDVRILVATGTVLQHVDVAGVNHLVSFDLPATTRTYERRLHYLAPSGTAHVFLTPNDSKMPVIARYVEETTGHALTGEMLHAVEQVEMNGGDNDWNMPSALHAMPSAPRDRTRRWRVRGKHLPGTVEETTSGRGDDDDHVTPPSV